MVTLPFSEGLSIWSFPFLERLTHILSSYHTLRSLPYIQGRSPHTIFVLILRLPGLKAISSVLLGSYIFSPKSNLYFPSLYGLRKVVSCHTQYISTNRRIGSVFIFIIPSTVPHPSMQYSCIDCSTSLPFVLSFLNLVTSPLFLIFAFPVNIIYREVSTPSQCPCDVPDSLYFRVTNIITYLFLPDKLPVFQLLTLPSFS